MWALLRPTVERVSGRLLHCGAGGDGGEDGGAMCALYLSVVSCVCRGGALP